MAYLEKEGIVFVKFDKIKRKSDFLDKSLLISNDKNKNDKKIVIISIFQMNQTLMSGLYLKSMVSAKPHLCSKKRKSKKENPNNSMIMES